jgi:hypothetical protein
MSYTKEQTIAMLNDSALLVMGDVSYRISGVDEEEGIVYAIEEDESGDDDVIIEIDDIDLSKPDVLLYKLTLMNGVA